MTQKSTKAGPKGPKGATQVKRDSNGLLEGVDYGFTEDGLIDWRKMVKTEYLVSNRDRTSETDVTKLTDAQLIILLGGIKELAQIRGYTNVTYDVVSPSPDYVVATCTISWKPNYETEGESVVFSAIGDASPHNTNSFARNFLGPIAENRAFVRCVRNFLKINIVAQEELGATKNQQPFAPAQDNSTDPKNMLHSLMREKNVSFEQIKAKLLKEGYDEAENLSTVEDLPKLKAFELIERLKKAKAK